MRLLLAALLFLALPSLHAEVIRGVVSHVTDGDSIWVRPGGRGQAVEVRIVDIDAPESCQAFGPQARRVLEARLLNETVVVRSRGRDDYQRVLGQVRHRGRDIGAWLVRDGHAWSMTYKGRPGPYAKLEQQARREQRGLWAARNPVDPRIFRRGHGPCQ